MNLIRKTAACTLGVSVLFVVVSIFRPGYEQKIVPVGLVSATEVEQRGDGRDDLAVASFLSIDTAPDEPVDYAQFLPVGAHGAAGEGFSGLVSVPAFTVEQRRAGSSVSHEATFPGFSSSFFSSGEALIPVSREILRTEASGGYDIILGVGRIWSEPTDAGWSRASFPFTLVEPVWGGARNGVASFLFKDREVSALFVQVGQESIPSSHVDMWGSTRFEYLSGAVPEREAMEQAYRRQTAAAIRVEPWSVLASRHSRAKLETFDGAAGHGNITTSGLFVDDIVYVRDCRTRFGPYPYCSEMRHMVWSVTKSLAGFLTLTRLAQKYGDGILDARIVDYVPLEPGHDGWAEVTFRDTINMATGIGTIEPRRVSHYVETDGTGLALTIGRERHIESKLRLISSEDSYPWGPGEVLRYRSTDSTVLAYAMDDYLKSKEGPDADLWKMMQDEVFAPLGIAVLPMRHIRSRKGGPGIPAFGYGVYPTISDAMKLARLLQNGGKHGSQQLLHTALVTDALEENRRKGLPTGWKYKNGTESHYHLSFWRAQYLAKGGCTVYVPLMSGHGGNYIVLMPKGTIGFRFADNPDSLDSTWDSAHIREVADHVKPFCG